MSQQERRAQEKARQDSMHQKQMRRNQVIFAIFSVFLILSMVISMIR